METLTWIFSHLCGQGRCFVIDGSPLPVCQRCLGLYAGALLTAGWLAASGLWRRGLPSWSVLIGDVAVLLGAMLGGLRVLDFGPAWRMTCGLWTGHVVMLWLVAAGVRLDMLRRGPSAEPPWRLSDKVGGLTALATMPLLAAMFPWWSWLGWHFWTFLAIAGAAVLTAAAIWGAGVLALVAARRAAGHAPAP